MAPSRIRDTGYGPGYYRPGPKNSVLDIPGLQVGMKTVHNDDKGIHVGVTIVFPRGVAKTRTQPCYAAIHSLNGAGECTGRYFIEEWGFTNSPIAFTDSMSIGAVYQSLITYAWNTSRSLNEGPETGYHHSGFPVVGETWGGGVTDIYDGKSTLTDEQILEAIKDAETRTYVDEGGAGGGAGMLCQGHKGGTGTSSRIVPGADGEDFVVAALVQTNYGQRLTLQVGGVPIGKLLIRDEVDAQKKTEEERLPMHGNEGSILVSLYTNAPLLPHQLRRLAQRATFGLAAVGGHGTSHNSSGDIFIAISTSEKSVPQVLMKKDWDRPSPETQTQMGGQILADRRLPSGRGMRRLVETQSVETVVHSSIDALFVAAAEVTEEAILNSMCAATDTKGHDGTVWKGLDTVRVKELLEKYKTW